MSAPEGTEGITSADSPVYFLDSFSERDRLYVQFELFRERFQTQFELALRLGGLSTDPTTATWRMIDICSGEGLYSAAVLDRFPHVEIVCIDKDGEAISTGNAAYKQVGNIRFYQRDFLDPLPTEFEPGIAASGFDVAVIWLGLLHLPNQELALSHIAQLLKPGGVVLILDSWQDVGEAMTKFPHPSLSILMKAFARVMSSLGGHPESGKRHGELLAGAGFTDISIQPFNLDVGGGTHEGRIALSLYAQGAQSARRAVVELTKTMDGKEYDEHLRRFLKEVTQEMHAYLPLVITRARKA